MKQHPDDNESFPRTAESGSRQLANTNSGIWRDVGNWLTNPRNVSKGVATWKCWSFWLALACYTGSFLLIVRDPFFQERYHFVLRCIFPFLVAFFLLAAINWELLLTGAPKGANLLLHIMMIPPVTLLFARMLLAPEAPVEDGPFSWFTRTLGFMLAEALDSFADLLNLLVAKLPTLLKDTLTHPWLALLLIVFLTILSIRNHYLRISAIVFILVTMLGGLLTSGGDCTYSIGSLLLFGMGFWFQWNPYRKLIYHLNVIKRLKIMRTPADRRFFDAVLTVMNRLFESPGMDNQRLLHIVKQVYAPNGIEFEENDLKLLAGEITRRMVEDLELVSIEMTGCRICIFALPQLYHCNETLANITSFARLFAVALIAFLWTIMPFDIIPDFIPFFGLLDDIAVNALSLVIGKRCLQQRPKKLA